MKKVLSTVRKSMVRIVVFFVAFIVLYVAIAAISSFIFVNGDSPLCETDCIEIFILTNGVHTDIVLPTRNEIKDWTTLIHPITTQSNYPDYTSFGWGDRGFYIETPTWADLKFKTAVNAIFYLGASAMHISFYNRLQESETCRRILITSENYQKIVKFIESSFLPDATGNYQIIPQTLYGNNDFFYEARRRYGLFYTCNTWANNALKAGELRACLWTPFDKGIFYHYTLEEKR